ncbi:flavodoxin family protein [Catenulispora sp. NL8]|uniref:Flavodoxin family protein n=1 Tax=Catenulispora pinistramenti TaxID=2705254 RepID=A0ABS5KRB2_9ACTN|nr:flavodoxin domain-containing protein [Catenulispora pinistramenti]MBS2548593.1 flavodoxin family protein [Catenulispora pinistramenti]
MRALIIYESVFGNTHTVAEAIAEGLRTAGEATLVPAADAEGSLLASVDVDLLIIGGPTHGHGLPALYTRKPEPRTAASAYGLPQAAPGASEESDLRSVLDALPVGSHVEPQGIAVKHQVAAAAFDTRRSGPVLFTGRTSRAIAKRLRQRGYASAARPASFLVDGQDQLLAGEIDRAVQWGKSLAAHGS